MKWSARWGAACDPCAKAKARCVRPEKTDDPRCDRCQSLNIECPQQVRKPRKKRLRRDTLDLPSTTNSPRSRGAPISPESTVATTRSEDSRTHAAESVSNIYVTQVKTGPAGAFSASTTLPGFHPFPNPTCTCVSDMGGQDDPGPPESDEALLSIYRTRLSPQFPFVVISKDVTVPELQQSRPFLAKAIRMVASIRDRRSMWYQSRVLLRQISDAVFMGPDRSLDLLQSIIVFLGFYHYFCLAHGQFSTLAHLASSMIADMRLDRPPSRPVLANRGIQGIDPEEPRPMLNDERRAVLAVWYLNSSVAVAFKKVNSPSRHFTQHMEKQLQELQTEREYDTDEVLAQVVCAQRMSEMIAQVHQSDQSVDIQPSLSTWSTRLDGHLADLDDLLGYESHHKPHRHLVSSHKNFALLQLLEPQLLESDHFRHNEAVAALRHTPDYFRTPSTSKKDAADTALKAWCEDWMTIPVCHLFYMPMSAYSHLTNVTVTLLRRARRVLLARYRQGGAYASTTDTNDSGTASKTMTAGGGLQDDLMLYLLERLASRFEQAKIEMAAAHCFEWQNGLLDLIAWKLRERKGCIEKWAEVIAKETPGSVRSNVENGGELRRLGETAGNGSEIPVFQTMNESDLWLDSLEALLMGGGDAYGSWM